MPPHKRKVQLLSASFCIKHSFINDADFPREGFFIPGNPGIRESGNPGTQESGDPRIWESGNPRNSLGNSSRSG